MASILMSSSAFATFYVDAHRANTFSSWKSYTPIKTKIEIVNGAFSLSGTNIRSGVSLSLNSNSHILKGRDTVQWRMNYSHYFKVYVQVVTTKGIRYLSYYPLNKDLGKEGRFLQFGLGKSARNGKWQTFKRDIKADLEKFDKGNKLKEITKFFIRGSGLIDDVEVYKSKDTSQMTDEEICTYLVSKDSLMSTLSKFYPEAGVVETWETNLDKDFYEYYKLSKDKLSLIPIDLKIIKEYADKPPVVSFQNNNKEMVLKYPYRSKWNVPFEMITNTYDISTEQPTLISSEKDN